LLAGGFTRSLGDLDRWLGPDHETRIPTSSWRASRRLANELAVPLSSVLLTAHAKVLGALSGEREVCTGYTMEFGLPVPLRLTFEPLVREVLLDAARAESELLLHKDFPVDGLKHELASASAV